MSRTTTLVLTAVAGAVGIVVFLLILEAAPVDSPRHWLLGGLLLSGCGLVGGLAGALRERRQARLVPDPRTGLTYGRVARLDHGAQSSDGTNGEPGERTP
ncbi:hypothetical protein [Demequina sp. NBRC 110053]|uniref:hypothetical protein n=1 Tax=Demequina sp. NBRC 110053 TaxID=1570342 RepID=UPI000A051546|nr:hypothetical protein [Demequina sp. NBRC 110053]